MPVPAPTLPAVSYYLKKGSREIGPMEAENLVALLQGGDCLPADLIRRFHSRLLDVHLKDSDVAPKHDDVPVEMGRGRIDLAATLTALIASNYRETVWLEYEKDPNDPVPGLAESAGYIRGLLRGLTVSVGHIKPMQ